MWSLVELFEGDEETNSTTKALSNALKQLYDSKTIIAITSTDDSVEASPNVLAKCSNELLALAVDKYLYIFKTESNELLFQLELESVVDCISITEDSEMLIIGERRGVFHIFHIKSKYQLISMPLDTNNSEKLFLDIKIRPSETTGFIEVSVLTSNQELICFSEINLNEIEKAAANEDWIDARKILSLHNFKKITFSTQLANSDLLGLFYLPESFLSTSLCSYGSGDIWFNFGLNETIDHQMLGFVDSVPKKCIVSSNGRYILILDSLGTLYVLSTITDVICFVWDDLNIEDFALMEYHNCDDDFSLKMALITSSPNENNCQLKICIFPQFKVLFSMNLQNPCFLVDYVQNQDVLFVIERILNEEKVVQKLNVHSIIESRPETKYLKLIKRKKFKLAEQLALQFGLDIQEVYKANINFSVENLFLSNDSITNNCQNEDIQNIKNLLLKIEDPTFVSNFCLNSNFPSVQLTEEFLLIASEKFQMLSSNELTVEFQNELSNVTSKLLTFQLLFSDLEDWNYFFDFRKEDLIEKFTSLIQEGDTDKGFLIWNRHQAEFCMDECLDICELLNDIPETIASKILLEWLEDNFLKRVIVHFPNSIESLSEWLVRRAKLLEITEKSFWPKNALALLNSLPNCCKNVSQTCSQGGMDVSLDLKINKLQKMSTSPEYSFCNLMSTIRDLELVDELGVKFQCSLSFSHFTQDDKMSVIFHLLNWFTQSDKLGEAIDTFLRQFVKDQKLNHDDVLVQYTKDVMLTNHVEWWYWKEAPWEERVLSLIPYIQNADLKMATIIEIASQSPIPWTSNITQLVNDQLRDNHSSNDNLKALIKLSELKSVLIKYDLRNVNVNDNRNHQRLVFHILKTNKEDCLKDALILSEVFRSPSGSDIHFQYSFLMLQRNQVKNCLEFLKKIPRDESLQCGERLLNFIRLNLNDDDIWRNGDKDYLHCLVDAGVAISLLFKEDLKESDFELFLCIQRLQHEFGLSCCPNSVDTENDRWHFFSKVMGEAFKGNVQRRICEYEGRKMSKNVDHSCHSYLFRLGYVLNLPSFQVREKMALHLVEMGDTLKAVELCQDLMSYRSSSSITLFSLVKHFLSKINTLQCKDLSSLINVLHKLSCRALADCKKELLVDCVELCTWTSLVDQLCALDVKAITKQSQEASLDIYKQWKFSTIFKDRGLGIDGQTILPPLIKCIRFKEISESNFEFPGIVINGLRTKGQESVALQVTIALMNRSCQLNFGQESTLFGEFASELIRAFKDCSKNLFSRVVSQRKVDLRFGFSLLCHFEDEEVKTLFKELIVKHRNDINCLKALSTIGFHYSKETRFSKTFYDIYKSACLEGRLVNLKIPQKDVINWQETSTCFTILEALFKSDPLEMDLIENICQFNGIEIDKVKLSCLGSLLQNDFIQDFGVKLFPKNQDFDKLKSILRDCESVLNSCDQFEDLIKCLEQAYQVINPYCYAVLEFVLEKTRALKSQLKMEIEQKSTSLRVLDFLKLYKRSSPPSEFEIDYWLSNHPQYDEIPVIATQLLPFHLLLSPDHWKIIGSELSYSSVRTWMGVSGLLSLNSDQILVVTIQNVVNSWLTSRKSRNTSQQPTDLNLMKIIEELLNEISEPDVATSCATWILKRLPPGNTKCKVSEICMLKSKMWSEKCPGVISKGAYSKINANYQRLAIEQTLRNYKLENPYFSSLTGKPMSLITAILEMQANQITFGRGKHILSPLREIAQISGCHFQTVCRSLMETLLPCHKMFDPEDETTMITSNILKLASNALNDDPENQAKNLNRAINLLTQLQEEESVFEPLQTAITAGKADQQVRALRCLFAVADDKTIKRITGRESNGLWRALNQMVFVAQLEDFQMFYSLEMFLAWDKVELLETVLMTNAANPKALLFCISLCLNFKIFESHIWNTVLSNLINLNMIVILDSVLWQISGISSLWHIEFFVKAWHCLLKAKLEEGFANNKLKDVYSLFLRCPCLSNIKFREIYEDFSAQNSIPEAFQITLDQSKKMTLAKFLKALKE